MGGGDSSVKPTEADRARTELALQKFKEFKESGIPMMEAGTARFLGLQSSDGEVSRVDGGDPWATLDKTVTTGAAQAGADSAVAYNPTSTDAMSSMKAEIGKAGAVASAGTEEALAGQASHMQGLMNLKAFGEGTESTAVQGLNQQAGIARQSALAKAESSSAQKGAIQGLATQAVGFGLSQMDFNKPVSSATTSQKQSLLAQEGAGWGPTVNGAG